MMQVDDVKNSAGSNKVDKADQAAQDVDMVEDDKQGEDHRVIDTGKAETKDVAEKQVNVV